MRKLSASRAAKLALCLLFVFTFSTVAFATNQDKPGAKLKAASNSVNGVLDSAQEKSTLSDQPGQVTHQASEKESDTSSPLLKPEPGMIIWTLIVFILLLVVLGKWVWPVILKALKDREAKLTNDFQEAETARDEALKTLAEYKKQLADAQREAQEIIQKSRDDARKLSEQLKEKTQQDLSLMRQRMENDIEAAKQQAIGQVHEQTAIVATKIASRILHREIQESDQSKLVSSSIEEFGKISHQNGEYS